MLATALFKIAILLACCELLQAGTTAPQPPPTAKDKVYRRGWFEHGVTFIVVTCALGNVSATICPAIVILTTIRVDSEYASSAYRSLCPRPSSSPAIASLTPGFILGATVLTIGATARLWCFSTLGRFFTFQVAVKQDHRLITSGPYAVVRHLSYTTLAVTWIGLATLSFAKGGYVAECGLMATPARWPILAWLAFTSMVLYGTTNRVNVEDQLLREAFGEEWLQYSQRVRYRLLPGVY